MLRQGDHPQHERINFYLFTDEISFVELLLLKIISFIHALNTYAEYYNQI